MCLTATVATALDAQSQTSGGVSAAAAAFALDEASARLAIGQTIDDEETSNNNNSNNQDQEDNEEDDVDLVGNDDDDLMLGDSAGDGGGGGSSDGGDLFGSMYSEKSLEKSIAAVFNKVAYGSTTTKRSIPDNVFVPSLTTMATPPLTTYR